MHEDEREEPRRSFTARSAASYSYVVTRDGEDIVGEAATVAEAVGAMRSAIAKRLRGA